MRQGKIVLPNNWMAWDEKILDNLNKEFTILEIMQSSDFSTYTAYGKSKQFREADDYPLYLLMLDEKNNVRFREFKEEDF